MNNDRHNSSHFSDGFLLGIIVGAAAVFLMGTKPGKNILKILSEQGIDGIKDLIDEFNLDGQEEELEEEAPAVVEDLKSDAKEARENVEEKKEQVHHEVEHDKAEVKEAAPKKRFFKRLRG